MQRKLCKTLHKCEEVANRCTIWNLESKETETEKDFDSDSVAGMKSDKLNGSDIAA